ncbi:MAG: hypothetical protein IPK82_39715 [Polyangiaceae bacterium]|nr:hypothetical protein [Polyangiaceae bacterium]
MTRRARRELLQILGSHIAYILGKDDLVVFVRPSAAEGRIYRDASPGPAVDVAAINEITARVHGFCVDWHKKNAKGKWAMGQVWMVGWRAVFLPLFLSAIPLATGSIYLARPSAAFWDTGVWFVLALLSWTALTVWQVRKLFQDILLPVRQVVGEIKFSESFSPHGQEMYEPGYEIAGHRFRVIPESNALVIPS